MNYREMVGKWIAESKADLPYTALYCVVEFARWLDREAAREAAQPAAVCDHDWITVVLSPLTRRCRKCGVER